MTSYWGRDASQPHRRTSSGNFRGQDIFARKYMYKKLTKRPNFTQYLPEKCLNIFFRIWGDAPLHPVCYAYAQLRLCDRHHTGATFISSQASLPSSRFPPKWVCVCSCLYDRQRHANLGHSVTVRHVGQTIVSLSLCPYTFIKGRSQKVTLCVYSNYRLKNQGHRVSQSSVHATCAIIAERKRSANSTTEMVRYTKMYGKKVKVVVKS